MESKLWLKALLDKKKKISRKSRIERNLTEELFMIYLCDADT
jgi:hypothetical protein